MAAGTNVSATTLQMKAFTVATAPAAASHSGKVILVTNGDQGDPCFAYSNGTNWIVMGTGVAIAAL